MRSLGRPARPGCRSMSLDQSSGWLASGMRLRHLVMVRFRRRRCHLSPRVRVDGFDSLSAIDGLIPDLQLQPFDHPTELAEFGRVAGIDAEQELLIVRIEDLLSAQGGRMRPDRLRIMRFQIAPEFIHIRLVELLELHPVVRQLAFYDPGWTQARV